MQYLGKKGMHALLESSRLLISEKPATSTVFHIVNIKNPDNMPYSTLVRDFRVIFTN